MIDKLATTLLLAACLSSPAWAVEGIMLRDDTLRAAASASAAGVGGASKGAKVTILARQAGWTQVRATGKTGWVRLLSVRTGNAGGAGGLGDVAALAGARDPNKVVATAGLRGLGAEELRKAQYDAGQMRQLEIQAVVAEDSRRFAAAAGLVPVKLAHLPEPPRQETKTAPTGGFEF